MKKLAPLKSLNDFKQSILPQVQKNFNLIDGYKNDNEDMKSCIRQFDKDLCLKANKLAVMGLKEFVEENYTKNSEIISLVTQVIVKQSSKKSKGENENLKSNLDNQIINVCTDLINRKMRKFDDYFKSFKGFLNTEDIKSQLD